MRTAHTPLILAAVLAGCTSEPNAPSDAIDPSFVVAASSETVVITEADITRQAENTVPTDNWVLYTRLAGNGEFHQGPGTSPSGTGSLELVTPDVTGADKVTLFNFDYHETPLADFTALAYHTYQSAALVPIQLPSINLTVDFNGPAAGGFTTLVFEPVYNPAQGAIVPQTWQDWDAIFGGNGIWWSTRLIEDPTGTGTVCATVCYVTWNAILAAAPNATILGGIGINQGAGSPALTASVDAFAVGVNNETTTYDFELFDPAASREDCRDGGWETVTRADGTPFANQGDCVSYTNTGI